MCLNNRLSMLSMVCCIVGMVLASPRRLALRARASKQARSSCDKPMNIEEWDIQTDQTNLCRPKYRTRQ